MRDAAGADSGGGRDPHVADPVFLQEVRRLCDETGTLLIFDEIQTGMGRTGRLFAYEHFGVAPDIMTLAKALGNGLPIGAMLAKENVMAAFVPGAHASTFGGTPVMTAAALAVVSIIERRTSSGNAGSGPIFQRAVAGIKRTP